MRSHTGPALSQRKVFGIQVLQTRCWPLTPVSVSKGAVPALEVPSRKEQKEARSCWATPLGDATAAPGIPPRVPLFFGLFRTNFAPHLAAA